MNRPGEPAFLSDLETMEFGQIYWIVVSAQVQLTIAEIGGLAGPTIAITGLDFAFDGVPETVDAGLVTFTFENTGAEFHEMILARLPEGMTLEEALALPPDDESLLPIGVLFALPGVQGGSLTVDLEPGTYAFICFFENEQGPHAFQGMAAEFIVAGP